MNAFSDVLVRPGGEIILPERPRLELPELHLPKVGEYVGRVRDTLRGIGLDLMAGFGDAAELKVLDSIFGDGTTNIYAAPTYLALLTATAVETDTGATVTEANYTGYLRVSVAAADLSAAAAGSKTNGNVLTFPNCTASSAVVTNFAMVAGTSTARLNAGDVIMYGACSSVTVTTTQTPPTVAASALTFSLD